MLLRIRSSFVYILRGTHQRVVRGPGNRTPAAELGRGPRHRGRHRRQFYKSHTSLTRANSLSAKYCIFAATRPNTMSIANQMRAYGARPLVLGGALVGIVVVSALAVRESMRNAQQRKLAAEQTVRDYAMFASYLYTTRAYLFARDRTLFQAYVAIHPSEPWASRSLLPPVTALAAVPDTTERCGPSAKGPISRYRLDLPAKSVTYAGARPAPQIETIIRDSIPKLANSRWVKIAGFGYLFVDGPHGRETVAFAPAQDSAHNVLAVYGYRSCYGVRDTMDYNAIYEVVKVLPPMVPGYIEENGNSSNDSAHRAAEAGYEKMEGTRWPMGVPAESLLTRTISDLQHRPIYQTSKQSIESKFYGVAPLGFIGGTTFWVALRPDVARYL